MTRIAFLCCTFFFMSLSIFVNAQNVIEGKVIDTKGFPISFATVKWKKDAVSIAKYFSVSDTKGAFQIKISSGSAGLLEISAIGFGTKTNIPVLFRGGDTCFIVVSLSDSAKLLSEVIIRNLPSVYISGDTTAFLADKFKRGNEGNVRELLVNIPGFSVTNTGGFLYNGKLIDRVLVNDDDLTGRNYNSLLANLDIAGIEQIQIIQNQTDKSNILSGLRGGNEQVLNIKYKRGFLGKTFGNLSASISIPLQYNIVGGQAVSLFDKMKLIILSNTNSTGIINSNKSSESILSTGAGNEMTYEIETTKRLVAGSIRDIEIGKGNIKSIYSNRSAISSVQFLIKPNIKLSLRGRISLEYDKYSQQMDNVTDFITGLQVFQVSQKRNISRRLYSFNSLVSLNYLFDSKNQLSMVLKQNNVYNKALENTILPISELYFQNSNEQTKVMAGKILYNRLFKPGRAFSTSIQYQQLVLPAWYSCSPFLFNSFFNLPPTYNLIRQEENQKLKELISKATYVHKIGKHILNVEIGIELKKENFSNSIFSDSAHMNQISIGIDSINHLSNKRNIIKFTLRDTWRLGKNTNCSFSATALNFNNQLKNLLKNNSVSEKKGIGILPEITIEHKITEKDQLVFSFSRQFNFSDIFLTTSGYFISDFTQVRKGAGVVNEGMGSIIRVSFFHADLVKTKTFLFVNAIFRNMQQLMISEIIPFQGFVYNSDFVSNSNSQVAFLSLGGQKISKNFRTVFSPSVNFSRGFNYLFINGNERKILYNQVQASVQYRTDIKKVQFNTTFNYGINEQLGDKKFVNRQIESKIELNWKFSEHFFLEGGAQYNNVKPTGQPSATFLNITFGVLLRFKNDKWQTGAKGANLLNKPYYSQVIQATNNTSVSSYRIFPRFAEVFVKYRF